MELPGQPDAKLKGENAARSNVGYDFSLYSAEDLGGSTGFGAKDFGEETGARPGGQVSSAADSSLGTSVRDCIDIFADPVATYDASDAAMNDGDTCLVVNAQDDEEINLYSDIEGDQTKTAEEIPPEKSLPAKESKKSSFKNETQSSVRSQAVSDHQDREEGELTPEPVPTRKPAKSGDDLGCGGNQSLGDKAPTDGSINSVLEEFNKRLAIIQEEAKLKSLELQKSFAEKLKLPDAALLPALQGPAGSQGSSGSAQDKPSDATGRSEAKEARGPKEQTDGAREDDPKGADPEETCIDCIAEKLSKARGENRGRRGRSATSSRDRSLSRSRGRSRSSSKDRFGRQKRRDRRRSTETRRRRPENRGTRTRSESRPRNDVSRGAGPRRERYALKCNNSKAASTGDIKIEKQRVKTLVKRQMKFISDVIDNPNPKTCGSAHHKEDGHLRAKRTPVSDHGDKPEVEKAPGTSNDLDEMERFLEQLRHINRKKVTRSDAYARLKKSNLQASGASAARSGPTQSRISIRAPLDDIMNSCSKDKGLYFSSTSRRRTTPKRRGLPTEDGNPTSLRSRSVESQESENIAKNSSQEGKNNPSVAEKEDTRQKPTQDKTEAKVRRQDRERRSSRRPRSESVSAPSFTDSDGSETVEERISPRKRGNAKGRGKTEADDRKRASQRRDKRGEAVESAIPDSSDLTDSSASSNDVPETRKRPKVRKLPRGGSETEDRNTLAKQRHARATGRLAKSGGQAIEVGESEIESSVPQKQPKRLTRRVTRAKKRQSESSEVENMSPERKSGKKGKRRREASESSGTSRETDAKLATDESFASEDVRAQRNALPSKKRTAKVAQMLLRERKGAWRHSRSRSLASFSEESQAPPLKRRKKKLIVVGKNRREKFVVDPELCRLLFRGRNKRAVVVKARKERQAGSAAKISAKCRSRSASAQQGTRSRGPKKGPRSEEGSDSEPTLNELEAFLAKLREKRKDQPAEEFYPGLELQSLRRESAFLDRHRAKRKAKLMACVAVTDRASAKEARFLEALKKSKDEYDIEKEKIIRKLKAGSDAIFLASDPKSGEKAGRDHERACRTGEKRKRSASSSSRKSDNGAKKQDESTYKPFDVSFAFKNTARKCLANAALTAPNPGESLASNKAQALLNTLRAKKKAKKGQQEAGDKAHED